MKTNFNQDNMFGIIGELRDAYCEREVQRGSVNDSDNNHTFCGYLMSLMNDVAEGYYEGEDLKDIIAKRIIIIKKFKGI